jgi:hypothetical protein
MERQQRNLFLCSTAFFIIWIVKSHDCLVVPTQYGPVEGRLRETEIGTSYLSFQAIPYAKPPEGNLRFRVSNSALYLISEI